MKNPGRLKLKWLIHAIWITALSGLFIYLNIAPPFLAVASNSMEPLLSRGDLILTQSVSSDRIQVGDVIVFKVASAIQEKYGYPDTLCHRVVRINTTDGNLSFRTKGDNNASEDPFITPVDNLVGQQKSAVSWLGYGVLYAQSNQGKSFLLGMIILFVLYANSGWFLTSIKKARGSVMGMSTTDFLKTRDELENKMDEMTDRVAQSMNGFSAAMSEYAQHISSHTGAIKSLAEAARHMESILSKRDALTEKAIAPVPAESDAASHCPLPAAQKAIEITPELKSAVKNFIREYNEKNGITSLDITPELRAAVWEFIQEYVKNPPLPVAGSYVAAIQTVKLPDEAGTLAEEESEISRRVS